MTGAQFGAGATTAGDNLGEDGEDAAAGGDVPITTLPPEAEVTVAEDDRGKGREEDPAPLADSITPLPSGTEVAAAGGARGKGREEDPAPLAAAIATLPSGAEMTAAVAELLGKDLALARKVDAIFKDVDFVAYMDTRIAAGDPPRPAPDFDEIQAAVRQIINEIGARPSDKNAAKRWALNFWQVAKTTGLISVLGFGFRPIFQSLAAQSMKLGQPDEKTGIAESVYYTGQAASSIIMLASAFANAKDKNWDATIGDLVYAVSMLGAIGMAKSYDVAARLATTTIGAAFYATVTEIAKTFQTMEVPQLAGVEPDGWRKIGAYAAGAVTFTLSFIPATAWSYSNDYAGPAKFADQDRKQQARYAAISGLLWGGALIGYNYFTPPLIKLAVGNQFGTIGTLRYQSKWKSNKEVLGSPKKWLKSALEVANDSNKFFAFVLVFNTYLALNGSARLGQSGADAIPNEAARIAVNTVVSSLLCLGLCFIYEMQYGSKKKKPSETLTEGSEGHERVEAALAAFSDAIGAAAEPIAIADLSDLIGQHAATLQSDAESALFTILLYTQTVPRAIEAGEVSSVPPAPGSSAPARADRGNSPHRDDVPAEDLGARPGEESLAMTRMAPTSSGGGDGSSSSNPSSSAPHRP
ncbi:hypothetical protein [Arboricoccus pini]|uniref:hypothetical protein n=1 Tax=Arboricoccus pini TaxID=1963835 RepID=UPI001056E1FA|nr:hypothetical protein [Arboricoccus pini]